MSGNSKAAEVPPSQAPLVIQLVDQCAVLGGSPRPRATPGPVRAAGRRRTRTTGRVPPANGQGRP